MTKTAARIMLLSLLLPVHAGAEVAVLYWNNTKVPAETRKQIELLVKDVATQYATENVNTDMGALDLLHGIHNVRLHIWNRDPDEPMYYLWGDIFCHASLTLDLRDFRLHLMHEFSHLYDYTVLEEKKKERRKKNLRLDFMIRKKHVKDPLLQYVHDNDANESRAKLRSMRYMSADGLKMPVPCLQHAAPNACVKSFDFREDSMLPEEFGPLMKGLLDAGSRLGGTLIEGR